MRRSWVRVPLSAPVVFFARFHLFCAPYVVGQRMRGSVKTVALVPACILAKRALLHRLWAGKLVSCPKFTGEGRSTKTRVLLHIRTELKVLVSSRLLGLFLLFLALGGARLHAGEVRVPSVALAGVPFEITASGFAPQTRV